MIFQKKLNMVLVLLLLVIFSQIIGCSNQETVNKKMERRHPLQQLPHYQQRLD
jgi:hypothetical protein